MDLTTFLRQLQDNGTFATIRDNEAAQFGTPAQRYLGATILPERQVPNNVFEEAGIRYRTVIANDGTRYSPVQLKSPGRLVGSFTVRLPNSDIGLELDANDYDAVIDLLARNGSMEQAANVVMRLADNAIQGLAMNTERQRWQAIEDASVTLTGDNGYTETVTYSNPASHRSAAAGTWSSDAYDPYDDILGKQELFAGKGYGVARIIASRSVVSILAGNAKVAARAGAIKTVNATDYIGRVGLAQINAALAFDDLPPIEVYDARWYDQNTSGRMLSSDVMVMIGTTGQDETVDTVDGDLFLPNIAGYTAIGRAAGQQTPGRALWVSGQEQKPPTVKVEAWQSALPVVTDPESIAVIHTIS